MADVFATVWEHAETVALGNPLGYLTAVIDGSESGVVPGTGKKRRRVRLFAQEDCWVNWGETGLTVTNNTDAIPLAASVAEYFDIEAGYVIKAVTRS